MCAKRQTGRRSPVRRPVRYTVDASVFVNAFNPREKGHAASLQILASIQGRGDPIIVPTLLVPEIAAAVARATGHSSDALQYALAAAALPNLTVVPLTTTVARQAGELAAVHRLRGADAIYIAVARRYGTTLVSRDEEQRTRGAAVVTCHTPEEALMRIPNPRNKVTIVPQALSNDRYTVHSQCEVRRDQGL